MAREISAIKSRPLSSGAVAVSTKPVSGTLMEGQMYIFLGEYLTFVFVVDVHHLQDPDHTSFPIVPTTHVKNTSNWFKSKLTIL